MPHLFRQLGLPLIAGLAFMAASLASEVFGCSSMKTTPGTCATACGCCSPSLSKVTTNRLASARSEAQPRVPTTSQTFRGPSLCCCSPEPAAPNRKPTGDTPSSRSQQQQELCYVHLGDYDDVVARDLLTQRSPNTGLTPKIPIYLRNSRLLF